MKPNSKKALKIVTPVLGIGIFATAIVCLSGVLVKVPTVSIGGSTAVLPLMKVLSNNYKDVDVVTSAGGSGAGINSIINGTKLIGMASKDPKMYVENPEKNSNYEKWKNINAKTITIAWDGIAIIYKAKNKDNKLDINENTIQKLYEAFTGKEKMSFKSIDDNLEDTQLIPFARNGGSLTSGTADAFLNDSGWKCSSKEIEQILKTGSYGNYTQQTGESNSQTWNRVKNSDYGAITYLSTGFVLNNYNEIINNGFEIATYNEKVLSNDKGKTNNVTKGYDWFRPFNIMISIDKIKNNNSIKNFILWILGLDKNLNFVDENSNQAKKIIDNEGYISLTEEQIKKMFKDELLEESSFFTDVASDYGLGYCGVPKPEDKHEK